MSTNVTSNAPSAAQLATDDDLEALCSTRKKATWVTAEVREEFLRVLAETQNVGAACELSGVSRTTAYRVRRNDPDFAAAWDEVLEDIIASRVRDAYVEDALEGRPVIDRDGVYRGKQRSERLLSDLGKRYLDIPAGGTSVQVGVNNAAGGEVHVYTHEDRLRLRAELQKRLG